MPCTHLDWHKQYHIDVMLYAQLVRQHSGTSRQHRSDLTVGGGGLCLGGGGLCLGGGGLCLGGGLTVGGGELAFGGGELALGGGEAAAACCTRVAPTDTEAFEVAAALCFRTGVTAIVLIQCA